MKNKLTKLALLTTMLCAFACNALPTEPSNSGATDDEDAGLDQAPEEARRIRTGVGVVSEALTGTSYTKDRIKQRYGSTVSWTETSTLLKGTSTCRDYEVEFQTAPASVPLTLQYKVWLKRKAEPTPTSNGGCLPYGSLVAFVYYETIRCPIPGGQLGPCWQVESGLGFKAADSGEGAGLSVNATCTANSLTDLQRGAWNWFKSQTAQPMCTNGDNSSRRICSSPDGLLFWDVRRTLQNTTPPNLQVWYAVDANFGNDWAFTCRMTQNCTAMACKRL